VFIRSSARIFAHLLIANTFANFGIWILWRGMLSRVTKTQAKSVLIRQIWRADEQPALRNPQENFWRRYCLLQKPLNAETAEFAEIFMIFSALSAFSAFRIRRKALCPNSRYLVPNLNANPALPGLIKPAKAD